jgi:hypothetical protein
MEKANPSPSNKNNNNLSKVPQNSEIGSSLVDHLRNSSWYHSHPSLPNDNMSGTASGKLNPLNLLSIVSANEFRSL